LRSHWRRSGRVGDHAADLGGESEAYLVGQLAAWLDHHRRRVPEWAWVNALSRSGLDDLVAVDRLTWRSRRSRTWATTFLQPLAADLALHCRGSDQSLAQLQLRFLWPLEARMAAGRGPFGTDPAQLAAIVRTALGWGAGRSAALSGGYPPAPIGRGLGHGRINRIALSILGPASVARRPGSGPPKTPNS